MRVAHILRKYNPAEWGGTETAVQQLLDGLGQLETENVVYAPSLSTPVNEDPISKGGHQVRRYRAHVPVFNLDEDQRRQLISVGGNLLSFDLFTSLLREKDLQVVHSHALNRIGGAALTVARWRKLPFLVTIHGGVLDLPKTVQSTLAAPLEGGIEWGKMFGALFRSRKVLQEADAIITCNPREAKLQREKFPDKRIVVQPHGVPVDRYREDHRGDAVAAFPSLAGQRIILVVGRIDPVKNQGFVLVQMPEILRRFPDAMLVLAGPSTDELYYKALRKEVRKLGLEEKVLFTGGLPPGDPRLLGLLQRASVVAIPSLSETFGLVILEAWAAGAPVITSHTSGARSIVREEENGLFFDLQKPDQFHAVLDRMLNDPALARSTAAKGHELAARDFDTFLLARRIRKLYEELTTEKAKA